jgi:hypothetical protein
MGDRVAVGDAKEDEDVLAVTDADRSLPEPVESDGKRLQDLEEGAQSDMSHVETQSPSR